MSVMYCENCHDYIDTDYNAEHFDSNGDCVEATIATMEENGASEKEIEEYLNAM